MEGNPLGGRIKYIELLRGTAAVLMILGHSFIVYPVDVSGIGWCAAIHGFIYKFHMPLFFVLAGIVYKTRPYLEHIGKKALRLLVPYCFFSAL